MTDRLEPPWDELDQGIRQAVRALFDAELQPFASCQGGEGHMAPRAFINIASNPGEMDEIAELTAEVLISIGWHGFMISRVTYHQGEVKPWPEFPSHICVEAWSP